MTVIAEGVEAAASESSCLTRANFCQGFYFARPMEAARLLTRSWTAPRPLSDRDYRARTDAVDEPGDVGGVQAHTAVGLGLPGRAAETVSAVDSDLSGSAVELLQDVGAGVRARA